MNTWNRSFWRCVAAVFCGGAAVFGQTVADSQKQAAEKYPALKEQGSPLNSRFLQLYNDAKSNNQSLLNDPNWPIILADKAAEELHTPSSIRPPKPHKPQKEKNMEDVFTVRLANGASLRDPSIDHISEQWVTLNGKPYYWQALGAGQKEKILAKVAEQQAAQELLRKLDRMAVTAIVEPFNFGENSTTAFVQQYKQIDDPVLLEKRWVEDGGRVLAKIDEALPKNFGSGDKIPVKLWRIGFTEDSSREPLYTRNPDHALEFYGSQLSQ